MDGPEPLAIVPKPEADEARRSSAFLSAIVENVPAMIFVKEAGELRFELFNRAGEELLGIPRAQMIGKNDFDFFPPDQAGFFQANDRAVLAGGGALDIPEEPIDTAGGRRWLHTRKVPIVVDGVPRHLLGISFDITDLRNAQEALRAAHAELETRVRERTAELGRANEELRREIDGRESAQASLRRTEEQLQHAQKMEAVGRLAGGVAHDFNNLLTVIVSWSELILCDWTDAAQARGGIEEIRRAAVRAADLTRQLLAFSRQQVFEAKPLDPNRLVAGLESMVRRLIGADVELTILPGQGAGWIRADRGQLEQVIMNLVVNARDAMPGGGKLTISTSNVELDDGYARDHVGVRPGAYVVIAVSDTGCGMDKATMARVFEPFFTTKERGKGTGLGLSTVFGIVQQSGGHVWLYSEPGKGTTFRVYLPRTEAVASVDGSPETAPDSASGSETILLVEDEAAVRAVARSILRRAGYTVLEAGSPGDALLVSERHGAKVHLLLSDVVMPHMNGPELAARLCAARPDMKVLFMSGYTGEAISQHGILTSGVAFLQKPFTPETLARKVRQVLG